MAGWRKPADLPFCALATAMRPAQRGATALVPPMTMLLPSTRMTKPVAGSASPATSGTPRPPAGLVGFGTPAPACQEGRGKTLLTPPPVAPSLLVSSFQTISEEMVEPLPSSLVPPQESTCGLEAGKSTWFWPPVTPSVEPLSPAAAVIVMPRTAADWHAASKAAMAWPVQLDSAAPQL